MKSRRFASLLGIAAIVGGVWLGLGSVLPQIGYAAPATFVVTNTDDTGPGSLRDAIDSANANGNPSDQDVIEFNIAGVGTKVIQPQSTLSINESVRIDGFTQSDATRTTTNPPYPMDGYVRISLDLSVSDQINIGAPNVTVQGLNFYGSHTKALNVSGSDNFELAGSIFNTDEYGLLNRADYVSTSEVYVTNSNNIKIGGSSTDQRNVISWCVVSCIELDGGGGPVNNALIEGNFIGVGADAVSDQGGDAVGIYAHDNIANLQITNNSIMHNLQGGVDVQNASNVSLSGNRILANNANNTQAARSAVKFGGVVGADIGDGTPQKRNIIGGQGPGGSEGVGGGIYITDSTVGSLASGDINVIGNYIGVIDDGVTNYSNEGVNVFVGGSAYDVFVNNNVIKYSSQRSGVVVSGQAQRVAITQNSIYGSTALGIDLAGNSAPDPNDVGDVDSGANGALNTPGYTSIVENAGNTDIGFALDAPAGQYRIEFYANTQPGLNGPGQGETFLGYANITHGGTGIEYFDHTVTGTGITNLALTATEITNASASGFGATSEFGGSTAAQEFVSDLSVRSVLQNPQDFAIGSTLNYQYTITNNGPDPIDISALNGRNLMTLILSPQLTYSGVTGDVSCDYYGEGSAVGFGPPLVNHQSYGLGSCAYSGAVPHLLQVGDSFAFTVQATLIDDANPVFSVYAILNPALNNDPDGLPISEAVGNGYELIDTFSSQLFINSFTEATSTPADMQITKTLNDSQNVTPGGTVHYTVTVTNNGPSSIDPTQFNLGGVNPLATSLIADFMPSNLTYVSQSNPDIDCPLIVPVSSLGAGPAFADHLDYTIMACGYFGADTQLAQGESISTTIAFNVSSVPSSFTNFALTPGNSNDPDYIAFSANGYQNKDILTAAASQGLNNISTATYSINSDYDSDGIPDAIEDGLAPNGDGNGDGIADKLQSSVATGVNPVTGQYTTLAVSGDCAVITNYQVRAEVDLYTQDNSYTYPVGLNQFELHCSSPGQSANVTFYYDKHYDTSSWVLRKLLGSSFRNLTDAQIGQATIAGSPKTTIGFTLQDGGDKDQDGTANGVIVDPSGPGTVGGQGVGLAGTGFNASLAVVAAVVIVAGTVVLLAWTRKGDTKQFLRPLKKLSKRQRLIVAGVVAVVIVGGVYLVVFRPDSKPDKKVIYDGKEQIQDLEDGLIAVPKDAKSFVCDAVTADELSLATGTDFNVGRVSIPTTKTAEGEVAACAFSAKDNSKSSITSIIVSQRSFTDNNKAQDSFRLLTKVATKNRTTVGDYAYYDTTTGQVVALRGGTLTTVSIARTGNATVETQVYTKLLSIFQ